MKDETSRKKTFIIQVMNTQHATWQGSVTWADEKRTESFRSALELIHLMESAMEEERPGGTEG